MAITVDTILSDISKISKQLNSNELVTEAKNSILESLSNSELSKEEINTKYSDFVQQLSLGVLAQAVELSTTLPILILEEKKVGVEVTNAQAQKDKELSLLDEEKKKLQKEIEKLEVEKQTAIASLQKQLGYKLDANGVMIDTKLGLVDKQINGFDNDVYYKLLTAISQENQMLTQNGLAVQPWQVDIWKLSAEAMTQGKVNISTNASNVTTANWNANATAPNGL